MYLCTCTVCVYMYCAYMYGNVQCTVHVHIVLGPQLPVLIIEVYIYMYLCTCTVCTCTVASFPGLPLYLWWWKAWYNSSRD